MLVQFILQVVSYINGQMQTDARTLSSSLSILENIVLNSQTKYGLVEKQITIPNLLHHISNSKVSFNLFFLMPLFCCYEHKPHTFI